LDELISLPVAEVFLTNQYFSARILAKLHHNTSAGIIALQIIFAAKSISKGRALVNLHAIKT
jgi:hypothetical protein